MTETVRLSRFDQLPLYSPVDRSRGLVVSLLSGTVPKPQAVFSCLGFSELVVKLEISLTLSGEIDNSNVKQVEEVSA